MKEPDYNLESLKKQGFEIELIRHVPVQPSDYAYDSSPCRYCSNNPANGGSGVCNCILGQNTIY